MELPDIPLIWDDLELLGLVVHPFELTVDGPDVAVVTQQLHRRHATDSAYVCLARRLGTFVWTLDGSLARNANQLGLPVTLVA